MPKTVVLVKFTPDLTSNRSFRPGPALELLALARRIGSPAAVVFGPDAERTVGILASHGAERVYLVKDRHILDHLVAEPRARPSPAS